MRKAEAMSRVDTDTKPPAPVETLLRQVEALDAWNVARHQRERMITSSVRSREAQLDAVRRMQVLNHAHEALLKRTREVLAQVPGPIAASDAPRAVVAHRHEWLVIKLSDALKSRGVVVVGVTDSGAEALGLTVAEQPDLLFTGDSLAMMTAGELLAEAALFSPHTLLAVQVADGDLVGEMLDAGAHSVVTQKIPPDDVASTLASLVSHGD